jgi:hypothetical protein
MADIVQLETIRDEIVQMKLGLEPGTEMFDAAVLLFAAVFVGTDIHRLAEFTGLKEKWIVERVARLQRAGIWTTKGLSAVWLDESSGGQAADDAFLLDICVAQGYVVS